MSILINNVAVDLQVVKSLVAEGKSLHAIKYIRDCVPINLKACKTIVDNIQNDPNYYDNDSEIIIERSSSNRFKNHQSSHKHNRKGTHIISEGSSKIKNFIVLFLVVVIIIMLYLFL